MKVNEFTLTIGNFENAAMVDDRSGEVARMLRQLADSIDEYGVPHQDGKRLMDSNGNQVGEVSVDWDDDDEDEDVATYSCYYGSGSTPSEVFYYDGWYAVKGSVNVNRTRDELYDGVDVEVLDDYDVFTAGSPINSAEDMIAACKD